MNLPFVTLAKYKKLEADHIFALKQLYHFKKKAHRLEMATVPRSNDGKFVKRVKCGDQIRTYYADKHVQLGNQTLALLLGMK